MLSRSAYCIICKVRELCTHVKARNRRESRPLCGPIRHNEALESELALEDLVERAIILACEGIVNKVWHEDIGSIYARR